MFEEFQKADDTDNTSAQRQIDYLAGLTATQRMQKFFSLFETTRAFILAGIQMRYPDASREEIRMRKAALYLGREFTLKRYHWDPEVRGY